jgi:hypothetical protein
MVKCNYPNRKIVENEWIKTPEIRPDMNLKQGEFVVMPNHFHAILIIGQMNIISNLTMGNIITNLDLNPKMYPLLYVDLNLL